MMTQVDLTQLWVIVGISSAITSATTTVLVYKLNGSLETRLCDKIGKLHERVNGIAIKLGILEGKDDG